MLIPLSIIAPVFGLIALGYICGRYRLLPETAATGISEFAFRLAIPALLFRTVATAQFADVNLIGVWASFYLAAAATWLLASILTVQLLARPAQDAPAIAMCTTFGNTVMLGLPLSIATFGDEANATLAMVFAIHAPMIWLWGSIHVAIADRDQSAAGNTSITGILAGLGRELARNPIIVGNFLGALWRLTGLELPGTIDQMTGMLAGAGVPAALISLGLSLVAFEMKGQGPTLGVITALKLIAMPIMAYSLAAFVFGLSDLATGVITILAATPCGVNGYLFAQRHKRAVNSASGAIALGTVLSAVTTAVLIALIHP